MNGARTTLEVRLVHCIGSVLDLEAVYTLMRSTGPGLVVDRNIYQYTVHTYTGWVLLKWWMVIIFGTFSEVFLSFNIDSKHFSTLAVVSLS